MTALQLAKKLHRDGFILSIQLSIRLMSGRERREMERVFFSWFDILTDIPAVLDVISENKRVGLVLLEFIPNSVYLAQTLLPRQMSCQDK